MNEVTNVLIGFELNREGSQICYYDRTACEPICVPTKVGTNLFLFPTALGKVRGRADWHFGLEAHYFGTLEKGICIDNLYDLALGTEGVEVDGETYSPADLLAIFLRESLKLLGLSSIVRSVEAIMVTSAHLTGELVRNIRKAFISLGFSRDQILLQNEMESFYYYAFSQRQDFWKKRIGLFRISENEVTFSALTEDRAARPSTVRLSTARSLTFSGDEAIRDLEMCEYAVTSLGDDEYSGILLAGSSFEPAKMQQTVAFLVEDRRRVYYGDNLFVKGACYAAMARRENQNQNMRGRLYMSEDLIETNVAIDVTDGGKSVRYPLITAGVNWYESAAGCELLLAEGDTLTFVTTDLAGMNEETVELPLEGLPKRPPKTTRIALSVSCVSADHCDVEAEDLGLGAFFPATHRIWRMTIPLRNRNEEGWE